MVGNSGQPRHISDLICLNFRARDARNLSFPFFPFLLAASCCFSQFLFHPDRGESKNFECAFGNPTIVQQSGLSEADRGRFELCKGRTEPVLRKRPIKMRPIIEKSGFLKPVKMPEKSGLLIPDKKQSKRCRDSGKVAFESFKRRFEPIFGLSETSCVPKKLIQSSSSRSAARVALTARPDLGTDRAKVRQILLRLVLRE